MMEQFYRDGLVREAVASCALDRGDHDGRTFAVVPPSTMHKSAGKLRWWHPEDCTVLAGRCTCGPDADASPPRGADER